MLLAKFTLDGRGALYERLARALKRAIAAKKKPRAGRGFKEPLT